MIEPDELLCPDCGRGLQFMQRIESERQYSPTWGEVIRRPDGLVIVVLDMDSLWSSDYDEEVVDSDEGRLWCPRCAKKIPYEARYS